MNSTNKNKSLGLFILSICIGFISFAQDPTPSNILEKKYGSYSYECGNLTRICTISCKCDDSDVCRVTSVCTGGGKSNSTITAEVDQCDYTGSVVNSISKSYLDVFSESASINGSYGCGPCGSGGSNGAVDKYNLLRYYASRRTHRVWDLGLGQATNVDLRLSLSEESDRLTSPTMPAAATTLSLS